MTRNVMTKEQYRQELERYSLTQQAAGKLFGGVQKRAAARWAIEEGAVPYSVALVIALMQVCNLAPDDLRDLPKKFWGHLPKKFWGRNPKAKQDKIDTLRGKIRQALGPRRLTESDEDVNLQDGPQEGEANLAHDDPGTETGAVAADDTVREDSDPPRVAERGLFAGF
jgi:hypothetical protein